MGVRADRVDDTYLMAHVLGESRLGLKILAYRHCGMQMSTYQDVIRPVQVARAYQWLLALMATYMPQYEERNSEKTGKRLKPKLLPAPEVYKAAARCLQAEDPDKNWRGQRQEIQEEGARLVGPYPQVTLHDC